MKDSMTMPFRSAMPPRAMKPTAVVMESGSPRSSQRQDAAADGQGDAA